MRDDKPDQFVDELLEASLKQYGGGEPRSGLEMRILAGIRTRQRSARRSGLVWAVAACTGTLAVIVFALHLSRAPVRRPAPSASLSQPNVKPSARSGSADPRVWGPRLVHRPEGKPRTPNPGVRATRLTRPEQFPTPLPLTEQEKLLLAYVDITSKLDSAAGTNKQDTDEGPVRNLEISRIDIAPLEIKPIDDSQAQQEK